MTKVPALKATADLAALNLTDEEQTSLQEGLERIFAFVEDLQAVSTEDAEPMTTPFAEKTPLRADKISKTNQRADVLREAPAQDGHFFVVPKFIE